MEVTLRGGLQTDLADVLTQQGKFAAAREQYEFGLKIIEKLNDLRSQGVILVQLGTLALLEGDLADAVKRYLQALELFQRLGEPASEAVVQHQLGVAFQKAEQWEQAEHHHRDAARLDEQRGDLAGAARTWNELGRVSKAAGKPEAAETWYRKAIEGGRKTGDTANVSIMLYNLADLLRTEPSRLDEARQLAGEALAIMETLDPGATKVWSSYELLAKIADRQSDPQQAAEYRRLARDAKGNFAGTAHEMKRFARLIQGVCQAACDPAAAEAIQDVLANLRQRGGTNLVAAIRNILSGERNADLLCKDLDLQDSMIVETILENL